MLSEGKQHALRFQLRALERRRRNPIMRYLFPDWNVKLIALEFVGGAMLLGGFVVPAPWGPALSLAGLSLGAIVWLRASFRTKRDERRDFVARAEKLGVGSIDAEHFYDAHSTSGTLI